MPGTFPDEARANVLEALGGADGSNFRVRLAKNNPTIGRGLLLAAITECDYSGYLPLYSSLWSAPSPDTGDDVFMLAPIFVFQRGSGGTTNTAYLYYVTYNLGAGDKLLYAEKLPAAVLMAVAGVDQVPVRPRVAYRNLIA